MQPHWLIGISTHCNVIIYYTILHNISFDNGKNGQGTCQSHKVLLDLTTCKCFSPTLLKLWVAEHGQNQHVFHHSRKDV